MLAAPVDARVREQIVAEARGNPLALLELPLRATPVDLAGGFGLPGALPLAGRIEDNFRRQIDALPAQTQRLLLVAAADPTGDPALVWRAAGRVGIGAAAAAPAAASGLVEFGARVRFRHPLVRSAAYWSPAALERRQVTGLSRRHGRGGRPGPRRLAPGAVRGRTRRGRGRRAGALGWPGSGSWRAGGGGGVSRAGDSADARPGPARGAGTGGGGRVPAGRSVRQGARAGGYGGGGPLDELQAARADWLRGQTAFASSQVSDAAPLLLKAAKRLEPLDLDLARETYLDAWQAAHIAGHLAGGGDLDEVSQAARALPPKRPPRLADLLLDGLAQLVTDGPAAAAPLLHEVLGAFGHPDVPPSGPAALGLDDSRGGQLFVG